jgi:O-antigen ligase
MSPHFKAFIAVFVISAMALLFFRAGFAPLLGRKRATHWAIVWLAVTSCVFLITNYWLFLIASGVLVIFLVQGEPNRPAIYLLLLCVAPTLGEAIPGFAGINKFIEVNPQFVVMAVVLAPVMISAKAMKRLNKTGSNADLLFLLYLLLQLSLSVRAESFTHMLRTALQDFLMIAPLFYVFSRYPKSFDDIRIMTAALVFPVLILAATSIPEFIRNWHFYNSVSTNWFGPMPFGYSMREGYLRATASVYNPIVWGYVSMCALGLGLAVLNDKIGKLYRYAGFAVLVAGILVSLSRGPWVGTVAVLGFYILLSPSFMIRAMQAGLVGAVALIGSLATPFGKDIIGLLPFVGGADDTISYRQQLLKNTWGVMLENPLFGSGDFLQSSALQSLRQGQGIIDIVNTYLQVGLKSGLVGLALFTGFFACVMSSLLKAHKAAKDANPLLANYCRAYAATLFGILLTIFTTSSEGQIPYLYWSIAALGLALSRIALQPVPENTNQQETVSPPADLPAFNWK